MMKAGVLFLCLGLAAATGSRPTPSELIAKFSQVLPGAFPEGLKDQIASASNLISDVANDLTGGVTMVTKDELEEGKRILKLTVVANIAQRKQEADELMDEEEFLRTSEGELKEAEAQVDSFIDNMVKSGIVKIVERDPKMQNPLYASAMEGQKQDEEDQKTSGLVSRSHKAEKKAPLSPYGLDPIEYFGVENLDKLEMVEKRPDLQPGGSSWIASEKRAKEEREQKAMARRWRQDPRPTGRLTSGDVLQNMEYIVNEIFSAYDHDNDNTLNLAEFNELQADTDGPDSVNTEEEFKELLEQVGANAQKTKLHFVTFKKLYIDPWMSEKFETILPVDYFSLMDMGKVKGEAIQDTWEEQDQDAYAEKIMAPIEEEDRKEAEAAMKEQEEMLKKQGFLQ